MPAMPVVPEQFHVYDTTLRDGAQQEGIHLSVDDKLRIAGHLDKLGVTFIEGGAAVAIATSQATLTDQGGLIRTMTVQIAPPHGLDPDEQLSVISNAARTFLTNAGISISGEGTSRGLRVRPKARKPARPKNSSSGTRNLAFMVFPGGTQAAAPARPPTAAAASRAARRR